MSSEEDEPQDECEDILSDSKLTTVKSIELTHKWTIKSFTFSAESVEKFTSIFSSPFYQNKDHLGSHRTSEFLENIICKLELFPNWQYGRYKHRLNRASSNFISLVISLNNDYPVKAELILRVIDSDDVMHKVYSSAHIFDSKPIQILDFIAKVNLESKKFLVDDNLTIVCDIKLILPRKIELRFPSSEKISMDNLHRDFRVMMLKSDEYKDVTFVTKKKEFKAHKCILSARSLVFHALFRRDPNKNTSIHVDSQPEVVLEMLRFIYTGKVKQLDSLAHDLLILADKYELRDLARMCEESLYKKITCHNAIDVLILSDKLKVEDLKKRSLSYIASNAKGIIETDGYKTLEKANSPLIAEILRSIVLPPSV